MARGKVKWFNAEKGYGFIEPEDGGKDVFVFRNKVTDIGWDQDKWGEKDNIEIWLAAHTGEEQARHVNLKLLALLSLYASQDIDESKYESDKISPKDPSPYLEDTSDQTNTHRPNDHDGASNSLRSR